MPPLVALLLDWVITAQQAGSYKPDASGNNFLFGLMGVERIEVTPAGTDLNRPPKVAERELMHR